MYFIVQSVFTKEDKVDVRMSIMNDFSLNKNDFSDLVEFVLRLKTRSCNWQIDNHPGYGARYESFKNCDSIKNDFKDFRKNFYNGIDTNVSMNYVADFTIPVDFSSKTQSHDIRKMSVFYSNECIGRVIKFEYNYRKFFPLDNTYNIEYFEGTDSEQYLKNERISWYYKLDNHWVIVAEAEK